MPTGSIHALFALQGRSGGGARRGGYRWNRSPCASQGAAGPWAG